MRMIIYMLASMPEERTKEMISVIFAQVMLRKYVVSYADTRRDFDENRRFVLFHLMKMPVLFLF